jgi:cytoskeletal protein CcmA (bactofilin family)
MNVPMRARRLAAGLLLGLVLPLFLVTVALAQNALGDKFRSGSEVTVGGGDTVPNDLYAFGGAVTIDGTVQGDLIASGGSVTVNGTVEGDIMAAGGTLRIGGTVNGDVRAAGANVTIAGNVSEDALVAGGRVEVATDGRVGEDMVVSSGTLTVAGTVDGNVAGTTSTSSVTGTIGGEDMIAIRQEGAPSAPTVTDRAFDAVGHFAAVVLVGLLALWLAPRLMARAETTVRARPLVAVGAGLLGFIGFVVLLIAIVIGVVLLAVVLGLIGLEDLAALGALAGVVAVGGLVVAFTFVVGFLADAVVGLGLAALLARASGQAPAEPDSVWRLDLRTALLLALGTAIIVVLSSLPVIGWLVKLVVVVLGFGAVLYVVWRRWQPMPSQPAAPAAPASPA